MADDYTFKDATGTTRTARADETANSQIVPFIGAVTAIPDVVGFQNAGVTTAQSLPSIPANATHALVTVDSGGGDLRFREDASNPTTSVGLLIVAGDAAELTNLSDVRVIATTGTVTINISYRRYDQ